MVPVVHKGVWRILERVEQEKAEGQGLPEFKFGRNEEMLQVLEVAIDHLASRSGKVRLAARRDGEPEISVKERKSGIHTDGQLDERRPLGHGHTLGTSAPQEYFLKR